MDPVPQIKVKGYNLKIKFNIMKNTNYHLLVFL